MTDTALRLAALVLFALVVTISLRGAWWTIDPWVRWWTGNADSAVSVEPIGLIESGKIQQVQGAAIARKVSHRLRTITASLRRDLTDEYSLVQRHLNITFPEARALTDIQFEPFIARSIEFDAKVFNVDIIGIGNFFYSQLYRGDTVKALIELNGDNSRYFADIHRERAGDASEVHIAHSAKGDVHAVIEHLACQIAYAYHGESGRLKGMSGEEFCSFVSALELFQGFITDTSKAAARDEPLVAAQLDDVIERFEEPDLADTNAPVVHLLLASLYKLSGDLDAAIEKLKAAERLAPNDPFVKQNLATWIGEAEKRNDALSAPVLPAAKVAANYEKLHGQEALTKIGFPALLAAARDAEDPTPLTVAVLGTGYTPAAAPKGAAAKVLPVEVIVEGAKAKDGNGHGNSVTNLLAALVPSSAIKVLPIKVLNDQGVGRNEDIAEGIDRAVERGARVILLPLGGVGDDPRLRQAVQKSEAAGVLTVAAAGNDGPGRVTYPAAYEGVVAVGATDNTGKLAAFSPGADEADLFGPGIDIATVDGTGALQEFTGSSFSATIAAALAAIAIGYRGATTNAEVLEALKASAAPMVKGGPPVLRADKLLPAVENP